MQAEGIAAATETYGRSADRARAIQTLGEYGRNQARFVESVTSAQRQYGRNVGGIGGALRQANMNTIAPRWRSYDADGITWLHACLYPKQWWWRFLQHCYEDHGWCAVWS